MNITALLQLISGKKTYLTIIAIFVVLFGTWQHWWTVPDEVYIPLFAIALAFLRSAVGKGPDDPTPPAAPAADPGKPMSTSTRLPLMLAFCSLALMFASTGCNTTPQRVAYQSAGTAVVSVDTAMNLWGAYVAANHPPAAQEQAVKSAYEKYQAGMSIACDAGAVYAATSVTNSASSSQASLALQQAIANANAELLDLENLLTQLGVKL